jgi:hypothetical protein
VIVPGVFLLLGGFSSRLGPGQDPCLDQVRDGGVS